LFSVTKSATVSGTTKAVYTYGGTADLWSATLTPAIVKDADFGVRFSFDTAHDVRIDYCTIAIEYTTPTPGIATSTNTALALGRVKIRSYTHAAETDTALAFTVTKVKATGIATETDTALAPVVSLMGGPDLIATGRADETDTALALAHLKIRATGLATETDTALELVRIEVIATGMATETDAALSLVRIEVVATGMAVSVNTALVLTVRYKAIPVEWADETDTAFALGHLKIRAIGRSDESDAALLLGGYFSLFYYPNLAVLAAVEETDPWTFTVLTVPETSYRASSRGLRLCGDPYLAAIVASDPFPVGWSNTKQSAQLVLAFHAMPQQLSDPDEVHWLFSQQNAQLSDPLGSAVVPREIMSLGVTPNGRVVGTHALRGTITSPAGVIRADGLQHQIRIVYPGDGSRVLILDGLSVVRDAGTGLEPNDITPFFGMRFMLFNGLDGLTRCACTVYEAMYTFGGTPGLQSASPAMRWAMSEGMGAVLHFEQYDPASPELGWVAGQHPNNPIGDPSADYNATLQWYDPAALGFPRLYGNVPTSDPATCYKWTRRTPYTPRVPAATTFTPVGAP
jgi:hypothetical protein